jgi:peptidoglycan/LPS O-acetylase OafA/YrhL
MVAAAGAILVLAAAVAIVAIFTTSSDGDTEAKLAFTSITLLLLGLAAVTGMSVLDEPRLRPLGATCVALSVAVTTVWYWTVPDSGGELTLGKTAGGMIVASFVVADACLVLGRRRRGDGRVARWSGWFTVAAAAAVGTLVVVAIVAEVGDGTYWRFVGAAAVLWALGTALLPVIRRVQRREDVAAS